MNERPRNSKLERLWEKFARSEIDIKFIKTKTGVTLRVIEGGKEQ